MVNYSKAGGTSETPVLVLNTAAQRETGRKAQRDNIQAAQAVASVVRTCLGPKAMMKMLLDPMNGITCTADGHAILREIDMAHPTAKTLLEVCRAQDEEVGDGTTSVVILAAEVLGCTAPLLDKKFHPVAIIGAYRRALHECLKVVDLQLAVPLNFSQADDDELLPLVRTSLSTKLVVLLDNSADVFARMALRAVRIVAIKKDNSAQSKDSSVQLKDNGQKECTYREIDVKRYVRIEKIPGGSLSDCQFVEGVVLNKDILHPQMRRRIDNPRVLLLDCPLEYRKGENSTNVEVGKDGDWSAFLRSEEEQVVQLCHKLVALKPDVVVCEKGVSDLAQHHLLQANVSVLRRVKKSDSNRLARACGAVIVNNIDDLREADVGTRCGLFHVDLIGNDYYAFFDQCREPKACTILLRGQSREVLSELERNLHDALAVARNLLLVPFLLPGGGAVDSYLACHLRKLADTLAPLTTVDKYAYKALARALEVIPRILLQNAGADVISNMAQLDDLNSSHVSPDKSEIYGIDGMTGMIVKMERSNAACVFEAAVVKTQVLKAAIEAACLILRVDDVLAGIAKKPSNQPGVQVEDLGEQDQ
jgi:T-complex protein 1 subunit gamma